jgi:hypothetical protein
LFSLLTLVDPSMQSGCDLGRYGRWNDRANDQPAQGEIEQSASTFDRRRKGVTSRRQEQRPGRPGRPTANHQGWLLRQGEAGEDGGLVGDRGVSSVGDVDQL